MPIIASAIKDLRKSKKRAIANKLIKNRLKDSLKNMKRLAKAGKLDEFIKELPKVTSLIDKAVKKHLIHKNNAARKKSALALLAKAK